MPTKAACLPSAKFVCRPNKRVGSHTAKASKAEKKPFVSAHHDIASRLARGDVGDMERSERLRAVREALEAICAPENYTHGVATAPHILIASHYQRAVPKSKFMLSVL